MVPVLVGSCHEMQKNHETVIFRWYWRIGLFRDAREKENATVDQQSPGVKNQWGGVL